MASTEREEHQKSPAGSTAHREALQALPRDFFHREKAQISPEPPPATQGNILGLFAMRRTLRLPFLSDFLKDLKAWRTLEVCDGRPIQNIPPDLVRHSDAADVWYQGMLGYYMIAGSPSFWVAQGYWTIDDRQASITLQEPRAVRLLLARSFARYVQVSGVRRLPVHKEKTAVVSVLNIMVSASRPMMVELRKIRMLLKVLGAKIWGLSCTRTGSRAR